MGVMIVIYVYTADRVDAHIVAICASARNLLLCFYTGLAGRTISIFLAGG